MRPGLTEEEEVMMREVGCGSCGGLTPADFFLMTFELAKSGE